MGQSFWEILHVNKQNVSVKNSSLHVKNFSWRYKLKNWGLDALLERRMQLCAVLFNMYVTGQN